LKLNKKKPYKKKPRNYFHSLQTFICLFFMSIDIIFFRPLNFNRIIFTQNLITYLKYEYSHAKNGDEDVKQKYSK